MPSDDLMLHTAAGSLEIADHWRVSGVHYARTARAWLELLDANREKAMEILGSPPYDRRGAAPLPALAVVLPLLRGALGVPGRLGVHREPLPVPARRGLTGRGVPRPTPRVGVRAGTCGAD